MEEMNQPMQKKRKRTERGVPVVCPAREEEGKGAGTGPCTTEPQKLKPTRGRKKKGTRKGKREGEGSWTGLERARLKLCWA